MIEARVYWTNDLGAQSQDFPDIGLALKHTEALRARQRAGEDLTHVVMSVVNSDCTSLTGVAAPSPDYNWKKRRL